MVNMKRNEEKHLRCMEEVFLGVLWPTRQIKAESFLHLVYHTCVLCEAVLTLHSHHSPLILTANEVCRDGTM